MIKNIVFDIGNVLLKWNPGEVVNKLFSEHPDTARLTQQLFKSEHWLEINRGKMTEQELIEIYTNSLGIERHRLQILMEEIKNSLLPLDRDFELISKLHLKYDLYALTDNVREIMIYLQTKYNFWGKFKGIVVSAEIGHLKPAAEIYNYLLNEYQLNADETLFIDDHLPNVEGAKKVGLHAVQFINTDQCIQEMRKLKIKI